MQTLLVPALALLAGLGMARAFLLAGALLVVPLACHLWSLQAGGGGEALVVLAIACTAAGLYVLAALHSHVLRSLAGLVGLTERIASGDLVSVREEHAQDRESRGTWGAEEAILAMSDRLADIVRQVRTSAERIVNSARDISEGNSHLSERTQEQASSLEETASGMEELAASAQQNAGECRDARRLAESARDVAQRAAAGMQDLSRTMARIEERARRVGDILAAVEGIAFQTNILALNAAVEAARAGDHGRGFAVVATEVRQLAQRSAEASKQIKTLIGESLESVEQGRKLGLGAESTMREVVDSVEQVGSAVERIADATAEQSAGIGAINEAVVQIDSSNQQNAAMVEQASAAADSFHHEAARLLDVVGRFKVDRGAERSRLVARVKEAVAHWKRVGRQQACADFNDPAGYFGSGDAYVFAMDTASGARLAYAPDHSKLGQNGYELQDAEGRMFGREILETARDRGYGWADFRMINPRTGKVEPKSAYVECVDGIAIGCGIYQSAEDGAMAPRLQSAVRTGGLRRLRTSG